MDISELIGGTFGFFTNQFVFPYAAKLNAPRLKRFIVDYIPSRRVQEIKKMIDTMRSTSLDIIQAKRDAMNSADPAVVEEMKKKKDIISILSELAPLFLPRGLSLIIYQ